MFDLRTMLTMDNATDKIWHDELSPSRIELDRPYVTYETNDFRVIIPSPTSRQCLCDATSSYKKCRQDGADDTDDNETLGYRSWV